MKPIALETKGTKESETTATPPSIKTGIIGAKKILATGETKGNNPEKYII